MPQALNFTAARKCQNILAHSVGTFTCFLAIYQENNFASSVWRETLPKLNVDCGYVFTLMSCDIRCASKECQSNSLCLFLKQTGNSPYDLTQFKVQNSNILIGSVCIESDGKRISTGTGKKWEHPLEGDVRTFVNKVNVKMEMDYLYNF